MDRRIASGGRTPATRGSRAAWRAAGVEAPGERMCSRADLHIHTLASDGVSSVADILARAEAVGLDIIAITDHERVDAAHAARKMAEARGMKRGGDRRRKISTRGGHLIALYRQRIRPWGSLRDAVRQVHDQGGLAIVAHPLVPYPITSASGR